MKIAVFHVGSSLQASLHRAERDINREHGLGLRIAEHSCTLPLSPAAWETAERDIREADIVFLVHITDSENSGRIAAALDAHRENHCSVVALNCMGELMRRTRLGDRELFGSLNGGGRGRELVRRIGSWMHRPSRPHRQDRYRKLIDRMPVALQFLPAAGKLRELKHYLMLFCYFMQPTPDNIRSMILYAVKHYVPGYAKRLQPAPPESRPTVGIYHPDAGRVFATFDEYQAWYPRPIDPETAVGLLLMRPQVVSGARQHYDALIRTLEGEGLAVVPVISTFMDNREACREFLVEDGAARVGQLLSLTGFSFVGGPAANHSDAAVEFLAGLNRPLRTAVSLETQSIESWQGSRIGLNPVQTAMQVAIPEIDGATEPFVFGGQPAETHEPIAIEERAARIACRLKRWNRLRTAPRDELRLAFLVYCFPPDKGNLGTAADLDVFPSLMAVFDRLAQEGYRVEPPASADELRERLIGGAPRRFPAGEYLRLCPYVDEVEAEWGPAPGRLNALGRDILIQGVELGNAFVAIQPTFGYEGDPMRLLMAEGGTPHHGFMGLYTWLEHVYRADALVHVGTHGSLEFMPGKQAGLSGACWPDRLIGELPNLYLYSVNNPSEGSIAKRRSCAELISYLTPPIEEAGLYGELTGLKELIQSYREARDERLKEKLFAGIQAKAADLSFLKTPLST